MFAFSMRSSLAIKRSLKSFGPNAALMSTFVDNINPKKTALILIEFQNEFATPGGKLHDAVSTVMKENDMLANAAKTTTIAREKGVKIFHVGISFSEDFKEISKTPFGILGNVKAGQCFVKDTWNSDFVDSIKPIKDDIVVLGKSGLCGFESTNLQFLLGQHNIETVAIAGFLTNCCVESTMRAAYEKGFNVITLTDCTAATSIPEQVSILHFTSFSTLTNFNRKLL